MPADDDDDDDDVGAAGDGLLVLQSTNVFTFTVVNNTCPTDQSVDVRK